MSIYRNKRETVEPEAHLEAKNWPPLNGEKNRFFRYEMKLVQTYFYHFHLIYFAEKYP